MAEEWRTILWFLLAVFIGLMLLPRETVMWGLILVAVGMVLFRYQELAAV